MCHSCAASRLTRAQFSGIFSAAPDRLPHPTALRPGRGRSRSAAGRCRRTSSTSGTSGFLFSSGTQEYSSLGNPSNFFFPLKFNLTLQFFVVFKILGLSVSIAHFFSLNY